MAQRANKALAEGPSPLQELEEGPNIVAIRPGRSQELLYKQPHDSLIKSVSPTALQQFY